MISNPQILVGNDSSSVKNILSWNYIHCQTLPSTCCQFFSDLGTFNTARWLSETHDQYSYGSGLGLKQKLKFYNPNLADRFRQMPPTSVQTAPTIKRFDNNLAKPMNGQYRDDFKIDPNYKGPIDQGSKKKQHFQDDGKHQQPYQIKRSKSAAKSPQQLQIEEYLKTQASYTRNMANTTFRDLYGKQCMELYGHKNTNDIVGGVIYGNYLKTHNINPHIKGNYPKTYQTHQNAINFAKRTKLQTQEAKWKRISKNMYKTMGFEQKTFYEKIQIAQDANQKQNPFENYQYSKQLKEYIKDLKDNKNFTAKQIQERDRYIDPIRKQNEIHYHGSGHYLIPAEEGDMKRIKCHTFTTDKHQRKGNVQQIQIKNKKPPYNKQQQFESELPYSKRNVQELSKQKTVPKQTRFKKSYDQIPKYKQNIKIEQKPKIDQLKEQQVKTLKKLADIKPQGYYNQYNEPYQQRQQAFLNQQPQQYKQAFYSGGNPCDEVFSKVMTNPCLYYKFLDLARSLQQGNSKYNIRKVKLQQNPLMDLQNQYPHAFHQLNPKYYAYYPKEYIDKIPYAGKGRLSK